MCAVEDDVAVTAGPALLPVEEWDYLFDGVRGHLEEMITWGGGEEALGLEHAPLEEQVLAQGYELMRLFTQAHLAVRTAREVRRGDVVDADGDTPG